MAWGTPMNVIAYFATDENLLLADFHKLLKKKASPKAHLLMPNFSNSSPLGSSCL
jgi:hypothetical protein